MMRVLSLIGMLLAPVTAAAVVPNTPCTGLVGCGGGASHVLVNNAAQFADLLVQIAAGLTVLFIVWSGFNMILAMGDESKISQFKNGVLNALLGLGIVIVSQVITSFVGTQNYNQGATNNLQVGLIAAAVGILLTLTNVTFVAVIMLAGLRMVYAQGKSDEYNRGRTTVIWCVIGAVVINLANALVQAFIRLFGVA
jgi:hypothetical protein